MTLYPPPPSQLNAFLWLENKVKHPQLDNEGMLGGRHGSLLNPHFSPSSQPICAMTQVIRVSVTPRIVVLYYEYTTLVTPIPLPFCSFLPMCLCVRSMNWGSFLCSVPYIKIQRLWIYHIYNRRKMVSNALYRSDMHYFFSILEFTLHFSLLKDSNSSLYFIYMTSIM